MLGVPTVLVARTDALSATLLTSDVDRVDQPFLTGERTAEGFFRVRGGIEPRSREALAYAPYADLIWCETVDTRTSERPASSPRRVHERFPGKLLAYNCSPSFNWKHAPRRRDDRRVSSTSSASSATGSSSSPWPASTR